MKPNCLKLAMLAGLLFIVAACKNDKKDDPKTGIEGTWKIEVINTINADGTRNTQGWVLIQALLPCINKIKFTFANGKFVTESPDNCLDEDDHFFGTGSGTYVINGDKITMESGEGADKYIEVHTIRFEGKKAILLYTNPEDPTEKSEIVLVRV